MEEHRDIQGRPDLERLLRAFYADATRDDLIGHFFTEVVVLDLDTHIPRLVDFWESVLLGGHAYRSDAMRVHQQLNSRSPMLEEHFTRWTDLWCAHVDALFHGPVAERAKQRAISIATVMRLKVAQTPT